MVLSNHIEKRKQIEINNIIDDMQSLFTRNPSTLSWKEIGEKLYEFGWRKNLYLKGEEVHWEKKPLTVGDKVITMGEVRMVEPEEYGVLVEFELGTQVWLIYESLYKVQSTHNLRKSKEIKND